MSKAPKATDSSTWSWHGAEDKVEALFMPTSQGAPGMLYIADEFDQIEIPVDDLPGFYEDLGRLLRLLKEGK